MHHTPSETPGAICLLDTLHNLLFVGDLIVPGGSHWVHIEEADFFKIREFGVSYNFKDLLPKTIIKNIILGISIRNIITLTKYSGPDPEVNADGSRSDLSRGIDFFTLQSPRVFNFWLKLSL